MESNVKYKNKLKNIDKEALDVLQFLAESLIDDQGSFANSKNLADMSRQEKITSVLNLLDEGMVRFITTEPDEKGNFRFHLEPLRPMA